MDFVQKTNWADDPSTATPITASELLRMEAGIAEGARDASESVKGNVELASAGEMTTGTDPLRVPAVKTVKDYVTNAIAGLGGGGGTPASETAAGTVELATSGEMTTGTDLARVPAVKRVADYVTSAINTLSASVTASLAGKADKSGSVAQFSDVADSTPADSDVLRYETDTNLWQPSSLSGQYAGLDVNSRLAPTAYPQYYVPTLVLNEGVAVPPGTPTSTIILRRAITASITPVLLGGVANGGGVTTTTCVVTTASDVNVDDYLIIGWFASGELPTPSTFTITIGGGTGAVATPDQTPKQLQGSTAQSGVIFAKCTTQIPAGRTITLTVDDSRGAMGMTVCKADALLTVSPLSTWGGGGNTGTAVSAVSSGATSQASELGLFMTSFNPGLTDQRTIAGTNGWTAIDVQRNSHGTNDRCGRLFYKELTSVSTPTLTGTATISNGTEPSNSVWSATVASLKAQG